MDFKETKEMIDATIYENGNGEITAQNVNLAMQGIVDAAEEAVDEVKNDVSALGERVAEIEENGTGGGANILNVWWGEDLTPEHKAGNVEAYKALMERTDAVVHVKVEIPGGNPFDQDVAYTPHVATATAIPDLGMPEQVLLAFFTYGVEVQMQLFADGSTNVTETELAPSEGGSGPLRVCCNEISELEINDAQIAENIAAYNALCNDVNAPVVCYYGEIFSDTGIEVSWRVNPTVVSKQTIPGETIIIFNADSIFNNGGNIEMFTTSFILHSNGSMELVA